MAALKIKKTVSVNSNCFFIVFVVLKVIGVRNNLVINVGVSDIAAFL
jgi:hypothetical protein